MIQLQGADSVGSRAARSKLVHTHLIVAAAGAHARLALETPLLASGRVGAAPLVAAPDVGWVVRALALDMVSSHPPAVAGGHADAYSQYGVVLWLTFAVGVVAGVAVCRKSGSSEGEDYEGLEEHCGFGRACT